MKRNAFFSLLATLVTASVLNASTITYQLRVNGSELNQLALLPGVHSLSIWGQVTDNLVAPGVNGGLFQAAVNLSDSNAQCAFEEDSTIFGPTGDWKSTFHPKFSSAFKGILNNSGFDVFEQTGAVAPGAIGAEFQTIGVGGFTELFSGNFTWSGGVTTLSVDGTVNKQRVGGLSSGQPASVAPTTVGGDSIVLGIPEPASLAMAGMGLVGMIAVSRRRKA